jgi:ATP-dependent Clp protease ATP-binding subunit ClpB
MKDKVLLALNKHFRPEFLNRIDDLIIFHGLKKEELREIVSLQLVRLQKLLGEQNITIELTSEAEDYIVDVGYDPTYGARPLKRAIQRELENPLATKILETTFGDGDKVMVTYEDEKLVFRKN